MPSSGFQTCALDRKSTRLNSSHTIISYAVFCLKKKKIGSQPSASRLGGSPRDDTARHATSSPLSHPSLPPVRPCRPMRLPRPVFFFFFLMIRRPPRFPLFPYTTFFRSMIRRPPISTLFPYTTSSDLGGRRIIGPRLYHAGETCRAPSPSAKRARRRTKQAGSRGPSPSRTTHARRPCPRRHFPSSGTTRLHHVRSRHRTGRE